MKATLEQIESFLQDKKMALIGASRNEKKFGTQVLKHLLDKGFEVLPVHPEANELQGVNTYATIAQLPDDVNAIVLLTHKHDTDHLLAEALGKGINNIWVQQFSETPDAISKASESQANIILGRCIFMYTNPMGFHRFHEKINKFFGTYAS